MISLPLSIFKAANWTPEPAQHPTAVKPAITKVESERASIGGHEGDARGGRQKEASEAPE
jgi:hypothetical protein